ncbi:MAG: hypothetical protein R2793_00590 [Flavobacteriaceae bacterium]
MSDKIKKIKDWLNKNGYPLEMNVARSLRGQGFEIAQSILYIDSETGKYRETDIIAHVTKEINKVWFNITFVFECKKTINKPWIVFKSDSGFKFKKDKLPIFASNNGQLLVSEISKNNYYRSPLIFPDLKNYGYNVATSFSENKDLAYSATQSVLKATEYLVRKSNESTSRFCNIYIPVIVIEGDLIEAQLDWEGKIDLIEVDYSSLLTTKSFDEQHSNILRIVSADYLGKFAMEVMDECQDFFRKYKAELEFISKEKPINIPLTIYDNEF